MKQILALFAVFCMAIAPAAFADESKSEDIAAQPTIQAITAVEQPTEELTIVSAETGEAHPFNVEIADEDKERQRGLMFRSEMAADHGMLFIFPEVGVRTFWMRNTYIPLDIVFIEEDGKIANIAKNAVPMNEAIIESEGEVLHVLELNAGTAEKLGIKAGDMVKHASFVAAETEAQENDNKLAE